MAERIPADPANAKLLAKYLKKIVVKVIHLNDFQPSKTKVEKGGHRDRGRRVPQVPRNRRGWQTAKVSPRSWKSSR